MPLQVLRIQEVETDGREESYAGFGGLLAILVCNFAMIQEFRGSPNPVK